MEVCTSITAVKYLYKYVYKGGDRAAVNIRSAGDQGFACRAHFCPQFLLSSTICSGATTVVDEIQSYIDGRSLGAHEALWDIFSFKKHGETPKVERLAIHLPGGQQVRFDPANMPAEVIHLRLLSLHTLPLT